MCLPLHPSLTLHVPHPHTYPPLYKPPLASHSSHLFQAPPVTHSLLGLPDHLINGLQPCSSAFALFLLLNLLFFSIPGSATPMPPSPGTGTCPMDILKLGACTDVLNGAVGATIGKPPASQCCPLIQGLADHEVSICLCAAIRANVLGINVDVQLALSLILNACDRQEANKYQCA
ncbi:putative lipid-binding protein AIR1 [Prosopis cineraria]|uniref:putative lipid-binding protein AIR1 n=1 Tax=Prosopis cineraria TaxID=364024 RepID=UPI00240FD8E0|nr:putative lipid-binding protein AIR1 [Prosopis cineraria]